MTPVERNLVAHAFGNPSGPKTTRPERAGSTIAGCRGVSYPPETTHRRRAARRWGGTPVALRSPCGLPPCSFRAPPSVVGKEDTYRRDNQPTGRFVTLDLLAMGKSNCRRWGKVIDVRQLPSPFPFE